MFLLSSFLDLLFQVDRQLRERQLEIERANEARRREARQSLLDELMTAEERKNAPRL